MVEARPANDGTTSSASTGKPKKVKRTTSYGDDHRSPVASTTPSTTSTGSTGTSTSSSPVKLRRTREQPSVFDALLKSKPSVDTTPEDTTPSTSRNPFLDLYKTNASLSRRSSVNTSPLSVTNPEDKQPVSDPKPRPTYLQQHPLIAQQVQLALQQGDTVALANVLDTKFADENRKFVNRMERRDQARRDYFTSAEIAVGEGDLDYTEDNPINPKLLRVPKIKGKNSAADTRGVWANMRKQNSSYRDDIDQFFTGVEFSSFDKGLIGNAQYRQDEIRHYASELQKTQDYYDRAYLKAEAAEGRYDNWSEDDEKKQDTERENALKSRDDSIIHPYTVKIDSNGKPIEPSLKDDRAIRHEIKNRVRLGLLDPNDLLSLLGNSDVLTGPKVLLTDDQQKALDKQRQRVADAAAEDERAAHVTGQNPAGANEINHMWNQVAEGVGSGINKIMGEGGDSVLFVMDKLTRPLFGINAARKEFYSGEAHPEKKRHGAVRSILGSGIASGGADAFDPLNDLNPGALIKTGWGGFSDGGFTGNAEHPVWGSDIIKYNADRDGVENIYDKHWFQTVGGLTSDLITDPTMYMGVGPTRTVTGGLLRLKTIGQDTERVAETTQSVKKILDGTGQELSSNEIHSLLSGNWGRRPNTSTERIKHMQDVQQGVRHLQGRIDNALRETGSRTPAELTELESFDKVYRDRLAKVVGEHEDDTLRSILGEDVVNDALSTRELATHMPQLQARLKFNDEIASRMGYYSANSPKVATTAVKKYGSYPKLMAARGKLGKGAERDAIDAAIQKHTEALTAEGKVRGSAVEDVFGPRFQEGTPFTPGDVYKALRNAKRINSTKRIETATGPKYIKDPDVSRLEALEGQVAAKEFKLKEASGASVKGHQKEYDELVEATARQRRVVNRKAAEQVINLLTVKESKAYRSLHSFQQRVSKELGKLRTDDSPYVSTSHDVETTGERPGTILDKNHEYDFEQIVQPDPEHFASKREQLEHYLQVSEREVKGLEERGVTTSTKTDNLIKTMPEGFKTPEGSFNWEEFDKYVTFNSNTRLFVPTRATADAGITRWTENAAEALNQDFHSTWKNIQAAGTKALDDKIAKLAESAWIKHVGEGVTDKKLVKLQDMFDGAEHGPPVVHDPETGEILTLGRDKKRFDELASEADKARSAEYLEFLSMNSKDTVAPQGLINEMRAAGYKVPDEAKEAATWLKTNRDNSRLAAQPSSIAGRRIFRNTHGMSVAGARGLRKKVFTLGASKAREKFMTEFKAIEREKLRTYGDYKTKVKLTQDAVKSHFDRGVQAGNVEYHSFDRSLSFAPNTKKADNTLEAVKSAAAHKNMAERDAIKQAIGATTDPAEVTRLRQGLQSTIDEWKKLKSTLEEARIEANESANALKDRLGEEAILRAATADLPTIRKQMQLGVLGSDIPIPGSQVLFAATEKISGFAGIKGTRKVWAKMFQPPSKTLGDDALNLARSRQVSMIPNIVEHHAKELTHLLGKFDLADRTKVFNLIRQGKRTAAESMNSEATKAIYESLQPVVDDIGSIVGDAKFTVDDLNRRLPLGINLDSSLLNKVYKGKVDSVETLLAVIKRDDIEQVVGHKRKFHKAVRTVTDPWALAWEMRIASETAKGDLGMYQLLNKQFGRARGYKDIRRGGKTIRTKSKDWQPGHETIEKLHDQYGWKTLDKIPEAHRTHLFPPEAAADIDKLLDMLAPPNIGKTGELIQTILRVPDMSTSAWKAGVTMYNPGYYTRNGVGEIMSSLMAGVHSPKPYYKADRVLAYVNGKDKPLQSLLDTNPMAKHLEIGDKTPKGADVALTMKNGRKVTYDDIWILYNDLGLKTGFFNTEFSKQGRKPLLGENPVGRTVRKGHNAVRTAGENYEDWLRLSHFVDVVMKSPAKTIEEAGMSAAKAVRKYHFDYTDFTPFEKAVMMRVFPFYKWTRKAMPLMASLLFTRPGKMTAFPKTMNYVSNELSNQDISEDPNGVAPNFTGVAPTWVQQLWGYQISEEHDNEATSFRLATPQMDALGSLSSPGNTAYTLLNPLLKVPGEQLTGNTWGDELGSGFNIDLDNKNERLKELLRSTPQGSAYAKSLGDEELSSNDKWSFMTGLGFYDTYLGNKPDEDNQEDTLGNGVTADKGSTPPVGGLSFLDLLARRQSGRND